LHLTRNLCSETRFLYPRAGAGAGAEGRNRLSAITFASHPKSLLRNLVSLSPRRRQKPAFCNNLCISPEIFAQKPGFFIPAPKAETGFGAGTGAPPLQKQKPGFFIPAPVPVPKAETGFLE
jgi:hypothetical protein